MVHKRGEERGKTLRDIGRSFEILLVGYDMGDVRLWKEGLKECQARVNLHTVGDGPEAMGFLSRKGKYNDAPRPDIIILDMKLPGKDGYELLAEIKADKLLKQIPVLVVTTSTIEQNIRKAHDLRANCYLTKPPDLDGFFQMVKSVADFWLNTATLPRR